MFYKSFLELNATNMVNILSFDSRSIEVLLDESRNQDYFCESFPIFYKNKVQKIIKRSLSLKKSKTQKSKNHFYVTAIDNALKKDQI